MDYIVYSDYYKLLHHHVKFFKEFRLKFMTISDRDLQRLQTMKGFNEFCQQCNKKPILQILSMGRGNQHTLKIIQFFQERNTTDAVILSFRNEYNIDLIFVLVNPEVEFLHKDNIKWGRNFHLNTKDVK